MVEQINPKLRRFLHWLSIFGMYMTIFAILYLLQRHTIGYVLAFNDLIVKGIPVYPIVYSVISVLIIVKYVKVSSPYE
ncbi:hypothetical protein CHH52_19245 [Shouchella clausii]|nr:hypothetical protein CHH52_19245 [Shouchella clausii]